MKSLRRQRGFSLTEMLVAVTILLVLMGALLAFGRHLRRQGRQTLCRSTIGVLVAAVEQYYEFHEAFPAMIPPVLDPLDPGRSWRQRNENLYAQLYALPRSRSLCEQIQKSLIGDKDNNGAPEFLDPWGEMQRPDGTPHPALRYEYYAGWTFPVITSAGPDGYFGDEVPPKGSAADNIGSK